MFRDVKKALLELNNKNLATIQEVKQLAFKSSLKVNLIFIKYNFGSFPLDI